MSVQASPQVAVTTPLAEQVPAVPETGHPRRWGVMAVLGAVASMAQLDFFVVNVALDGIGQSFPGVRVASVSWVLSAYAIAFAAVLVPAGRIADHWGRRKVLLSGVGVFTVASAVAAAAPSLGVLVAARAVQAVGAAMIVPTSLGLLYPSFPQRQHTLVVGLWAGVGAVAASAGPPVGGLLVTLDWRWIFVINVPIGIATVVAGALLLPEVRQRRGARLPDAASVLALPLAVSLLVLATVEGPGWGWTDARTLALFAAAAVAGAVTVERTLRAKAPVIERQLFTSRPFTAATVALFLFFVGFAIVLLSTALFMQEVWHFSPLRAGVSIAPAPLASIAFAMYAGPIQRRFGRTAPAVTGTLMMALAAVYWAAAVHATPDYWSGMFPGLILVGLAGGLAQAPMFAAAGTLAPERATTGSAVLNMSRQIGSAVGVAVLVALTPQATITGFDYAWSVQAGAGLAAGTALLALRPRRTP
ncbi:Drug resistance transporter EmrB/QacA subfamily [Rhodococcus wratislaviensis]|uniref:Drug resistance transporter EmrB/QacA subfamily n=1 Tax=Rhodococcus wratislaviensis TaxID=44752 RepID=A0A402C5C3_RHOWR|nr:MFS transporter [Rhodococcus wratislaviensis]GCE38796.1 Drug resistance transporter EmrB/QacA subfamily [Rhodococcus wratislaviensis]